MERDSPAADGRCGGAWRGGGGGYMQVVSVETGEFTSANYSVLVSLVTVISIGHRLFRRMV